MKNETAKREIESLDYYLQNHTDDYSEESHTAMMMAVKALEQEPCENAIIRSETIKYLNTNMAWYDEDGEIADSDEKLKAITDLINGVPSAQPKTGHWIDIMVGDMPAQACDQCNTFYPLAYTGGGHNYCPNCGARMVDPQESEVQE